MSSYDKCADLVLAQHLPFVNAVIEQNNEGIRPTNKYRPMALL